MYVGVTIMSPAKTAELIERPFGMWTGVGPRKHVLDGVHTCATWRTQLNRTCVAEMPFCQITYDHLFTLLTLGFPSCLDYAKNPSPI